MEYTDLMLLADGRQRTLTDVFIILNAKLVRPEPIYSYSVQPHFVRFMDRPLLPPSADEEAMVGSKLCQGSKRSVLTTIWHWSIYSVYVVTFATPLIAFFAIVIGFALATIPFFFTVVILMLIFNIGLLCTGRFTPAYEYTALSQQPNGIRLLEILPGLRNDRVSCHLVEGTWDSSEYEALSYTWACEFGYSLPAYIDRRTVNLTPTLRRALTFLRYEDRSRIIWIDAICINQKDADEKAPKFNRCAMFTIMLGA